MNISMPRVPCFFTLAGGRGLRDYFNPLYCLYLEEGRYHAITSALEHMHTLMPDFALSLTTVTAYRNDIAGSISNQIRNVFGLSLQTEWLVRICLQEALVNAVVHGNLGVGAMRNFDGYYDTIEAKLAEESLRNRRITVAAYNRENCITLTVSDEGAGFSLPPPALPQDASHGRGLYLIRRTASNVWVGDDSKTLHMTFNF